MNGTSHLSGGDVGGTLTDLVACGEDGGPARSQGGHRLPGSERTWRGRRPALDFAAQLWRGGFGFGRVRKYSHPPVNRGHQEVKEMEDIGDILDLNRYPLDRPASPRGRALVAECRAALDRDDLFNLEGLMRPAAVCRISPLPRRVTSCVEKTSCALRGLESFLLKSDTKTSQIAAGARLPAHELRRLRYRHHPPPHPSCIPAGDRATGRGCARSDDARLWKGFLRDLLPLHDGQANARLFRPRLDNCSRSPPGRRRSFLPCRCNPDAIPRVFSDVHVDREERRILDNETWPKARSMDWIWRVEYRFHMPCLWPRRIADGRPDRTSPIRNPGRQVDRVSTLSILQSHVQPLLGDLRRHQSGPILWTTDLHGDDRIP